MQVRFLPIYDETVTPAYCLCFTPAWDQNIIGPCMFCFPFSDYGTVPQKTVSFKYVM